jgi:hypothetical protein
VSINLLVFGSNLVSAITAFCAAIFWFWSGAGKLPPMKMYWDEAPANDPFYLAFVASIKRNRIAATLAGVSALAMSVAVILQNLGR